MKKALMVATVGLFIYSFEQNDISILQEQGYEVTVACNTKGYEEMVAQLDCKVVDIPFARSPFSKQNISCYHSLVSLMQTEQFDIVHCHTPVGGVIGRMAAKKCGVPHIVYTAHGFHFFKGAPILNWLLFYPVEKHFAKITDVLITINQEDYNRAKTKFRAGQIQKIPGVGLNVQNIRNITTTRQQMREELSIPQNAFVVLSVGELNQNKNHEVILRAIHQLHMKQIYYVICGVGSNEEHLKELVDELQLQEQVIFIGYRKDIYRIYRAANIFAFPSKREGLGIAALEAMASGLPLVTSNVHGIMDYSQNGVTGFCCDRTDAAQFAKAIRTLYEDSQMCEKMGQYNYDFVMKYDISNTDAIMRSIYGQF